LSDIVPLIVKTILINPFSVESPESLKQVGITLLTNQMHPTLKFLTFKTAQILKKLNQTSKV
jgi:hypothetical protein